MGGCPNRVCLGPNRYPTFAYLAIRFILYYLDMFDPPGNRSGWPRSWALGVILGAPGRGFEGYEDSPKTINHSYFVWWPNGSYTAPPEVPRFDWGRSVDVPESSGMSRTLRRWALEPRPWACAAEAQGPLPSRKNVAPLSRKQAPQTRKHSFPSEKHSFPSERT